MADGDTKKRRVKNPETFRERAIKASESPDKLGRGRKVRAAGGKLASPVRTASGKVAGTKPAKIIGKPVRLFGLILVPPYFRNSWKELRLVTWPTKRQSLRLTFAVIVFAVIFGVSIAGLDWVLDKIFKELLLS